MNPLALTSEALREPWRLWTGHLLHFSWSHALTNLVAFAIPSFLAHREDRLRLGLLLLGIAPLLSLLLLPSLQGGHYRGASGLICALWAMVGLRLTRRNEARTAGFLMLGVLGLKLALEAHLGRGVISPGSGWQPLPVAHVWGTLLGLGAGAAWHFVCRRPANSMATN